jgi:hypothetical protein
MAERRDLRFQMAQLKQKLEHEHQSSTVDMEIWHEGAQKLSSELEAKLTSMAPIGQRISAHFKTFPELQQHLTKTDDATVLC